MIKTFIEDSQKDVSQDIIEFTESPMFIKFQDIMKQYYVSKLLSFHQKSDNPSNDRQYLQIYLNLAGDLKFEAERIIEQRKLEMEDKI